MTMSVPSTTPTGIPEIPADANLNLVDPEMILTYCAARLNALDTMIAGRFKEQKQRNEQIKELNRVIEILSLNADNLRSIDGGKWAEEKAGMLADIFNSTDDPLVRAEAGKAIESLTAQPVSETMVNGKIDKTKIKYDDAKFVAQNRGKTAEAWSQFIGTFKAKQEELAKDNELTMIQMQQVISQRQLCIQMTTQLMANFSDCKKKVAENIGK